jgi:thioredoxin-dependent peroxiredoxin
MSRTALTAIALGLFVAACDKREPQAAQPSAQPQAAQPAPQAAAGERQSLLAAGDEAPRIDAVAHNGQKVSLADYEGKPVIVYFYPKDDTPGCTLEAQGFRDDFGELTKLGAVVIGVSTDDQASHRAFAEKHQLPFLLFADTDHRIAKAFGVPLSNGRAKRVTFVIDQRGKVAKVFPEVSPKQHAAEVRAAVSQLAS